MLHILWIIVKTLLILIGSLLGIVLLFLLLFLFCPFRYEAEGEKTEGYFRAKGKISWLFSGISGTVDYNNGESSFRIRILGISLENYKKVFRKLKSRKKALKIVKELPEKSDKPSKTVISVQEEDLEEKQERVDKPADSSKIAEQDQIEVPADKKKVQKQGMFSKIWSTIKRKGEKLLKIPSKLKRAFRNIRLTIIKICDKIKQYKNLWEDERTKEAVKLLWRECKGLFIHMSPRKLKGSLIIGNEDPSVTGAVLAVLGATCPIHKNKIQIIPVFDHDILEGSLYIKGRIYGIVFLKAALEIYFNKNIKYVIRRWKRKEGA